MYVSNILQVIKCVFVAKWAMSNSKYVFGLQ